MIEGLADFLENELFDHVFRNLSFTSPVTVYVALYPGAPGEAGGGTEVTGGAYARQAITFGAPTDGSGSNSALITFPTATAAWGTITHWAILDAVTAGNFLAHGPLAGAKIIAQGEASTELLHSEAHGFVNDTTVTIKAITGHAIPAGLSADTLYHVVAQVSDDFSLALTQGGSAIDITANGICQIAEDKRRIINDTDTFEFAIGALVAAFR